MNRVYRHVTYEVMADSGGVVDPLNGIIPGVERGGLTLSELAADFSPIENLPLLRAANHICGVARDGSEQEDSSRGILLSS